MKGAAFSLPNISVILRADSRLIRPDLRQLQPDNLAAHAQRAENERVYFLRVRSTSANALKPAAVFPSTWCIVVHMSRSIPLSPEPVADAYDLLDGRIWTARLD
jgi:hypothetical protein